MSGNEESEEIKGAPKIRCYGKENEAGRCDDVLSRHGKQRTNNSSDHISYKP